MADHPHADLAKVMKKTSGVELDPCWIVVTRETIFGDDLPSAAQLENFIAEKEPEAGWIWRKGEPGSFHHKRSFLELVSANGERREDDRITDAQFAIGENASGQLRHMGRNRWEFELIEEMVEMPENGEAFSVLAEEVVHLAADMSIPPRDGNSQADLSQSDPVFLYRRYYAIDENGLATIIAARFVGYDWKERE